MASIMVCACVPAERVNKLKCIHNPYPHKIINGEEKMGIYDICNLQFEVDIHRSEFKIVNGGFKVF